MSFKATKIFTGFKTCILLWFSCGCFAQSQLKTFDNGLIYEEKAMNNLRYIVDSLNLQYLNCELNKVYYSKNQAKAAIILLASGNIEQARKDIDNNISLEDFIKKYPQAIIEKKALIVKHEYIDRKQNKAIKYSEVDFTGDSYPVKIRISANREPQTLKNTWVYFYTEGGKYTAENLEALYFIEEFKSYPLKENYARLIGYADCLIDTTTTKFKEELTRGEIDLPPNWHDFPEKRKEKLLDKLRSTEVIGSCSMDTRPRQHAVNIALLSAATTNWKVFLRAHLDILNDRFVRMSDGSYALEHRKTYIKELEELNINVQDLLLGISLRMENPSSNHYYGSVGRIGRSISESKNREGFEERILSMVQDKELDDFNRSVAYFLFLNYNYHLENENEKKENKLKLIAAVESLPNYLKEKIKQP